MCSPQSHRVHGDVIFFVCREIAANEKHQPYRADTIAFSSEGRLFLPILPWIIGMGKKYETLCDLGVSVVSQYYLRYVTVIMN